MKRSLDIALGGSSTVQLVLLRTMLVELGHRVVVAAATGQELVDYCTANEPDLIISEIRLPDMDGLKAVTMINQIRPCPVILVSNVVDESYVERVPHDFLWAYLVKPIRLTDLQPAVTLAVRNFEAFQSLRAEAAELRQTLADRKIIERAKGIAMKRLGFGEEEAFRHLQRLAKNKRQKLVEIAESILADPEALCP